MVWINCTNKILRYIFVFSCNLHTFYFLLTIKRIVPQEFIHIQIKLVIIYHLYKNFYQILKKKRNKKQISKKANQTHKIVH